MLIITLFSVSFISLIDCLQTFFYLNAFAHFLVSMILLVWLIINLDFVYLLLNQNTKNFHCYFRFLTLVLSLQILLLHIYFINCQTLTLNAMESALGLGLFRNRINYSSHLIWKFLTSFFLIDYFYKIYLLLLLRLHRYPIQDETFCFSTKYFISLFDLILFNQIEIVVKVLIYFLHQIKLLLTRENLDLKQEMIAISDIYLLFHNDYYRLYFLFMLNQLFTYFNYQSLFLFE